MLCIKIDIAVGKPLRMLIHSRVKDDQSKSKCCCKQRSDLIFILLINSEELYLHLFVRSIRSLTFVTPAETKCSK